MTWTLAAGKAESGTREAAPRGFRNQVAHTDAAFARNRGINGTNAPNGPAASAVRWGMTRIHAPSSLKRVTSCRRGIGFMEFTGTLTPSTFWMPSTSF